MRWGCDQDVVFHRKHMYQYTLASMYNMGKKVNWGNPFRIDALDHCALAGASNGSNILW